MEPRSAFLSGAHFGLIEVFILPQDLPSWAPRAGAVAWTLLSFCPWATASQKWSMWQAPCCLVPSAKRRVPACAEGCSPCRASCVQLWEPCPRHDLFPQPLSFLTGPFQLLPGPLPAIDVEQLDTGLTRPATAVVQRGASSPLLSSSSPFGR